MDFAPSFGTTSQHPANEVDVPALLYGVLIMKVLAVKMVGRRPLVARRRKVAVASPNHQRETADYGRERPEVRPNRLVAQLTLPCPPRPQASAAPSGAALAWAPD